MVFSYTLNPKPKSLVAGEGSYGQLVRRYGTEGAARVVGNLRCVWISHIHADHHAGLPRLLTVRQRVLGQDAPPLPVRAPNCPQLLAFEVPGAGTEFDLQCKAVRIAHL